ncbi:MAG: oligosaccharide flippase family protein, partial [Bdellovibrionales bacterium]
MTDQGKESDSRIITNAALLYVAMLAVTLAVIMAVTTIINTNDTYRMLFFLVLGEALSNAAILIARLRLSLKLFAVLSILKPLLTLCLGVILIEAGFGVTGALAALGLAAILAAIIGGIRLRDFKTLSRKRIGAKDIGALLRFGLPLIAALSVQSAVKSTDRILLETLMGSDITGLYAAAQDIPLKLLTLLIGAVHLAVYPLAVKALDHGGPASCRKQLARNAALLAGVLCPAVFGIIILAPQLSAVFLGVPYRGFATVYIGIFALIAAVNMITQYYFILAFNLSRQTRRMVMPFIAAFTINAAAGVVLIPVIGAAGAVIGSALAYAVMLAMAVTRARDIFPMPLPLDALVKILAASAVMSVLALSVQIRSPLLDLGITTLVAGGAYLIAVFVLDPMDIRKIMI